MRTATKPPIKKAAVPTATRTQNYYESSYPQDSEPSRANLKLQLGEFLFLLQAPLKPYEREICLQTFESLLREYVGYKGEQR